MGYDRATTFEQFAKLEATEKTVVDAHATAKNHLSSAEAVEGDEFPTSEKRASTSLETIVQRKAAAIEIVEGSQAFDVEEDMALSRKGGELTLKEPAVEDNNDHSANGQEPTSIKAGKPETGVKEEVGDSPPSSRR